MLTSISLSILIFGVFALVFDGVWSLVARWSRSRYSRLAAVSFLIYFVAGVMAGLGAHSTANRILAGVIAGAAVSAIDSTLGWWISSVVGPGRPAPGQSIVKTVIVVILFGTICGGLGGLMSPLASELGSKLREITSLERHLAYVDEAYRRVGLVES